MELIAEQEKTIIDLAKVIFNDKVNVDFYKYHLQLSFDKKELNLISFRKIKMFYEKIQQKFDMNFHQKVEDVDLMYDENCGLSVSFFYSNFDESHFRKLLNTNYLPL